MSCINCGAPCQGDRCLSCESIAAAEAAAERAERELAARDEGGGADGS